MKISLTRTKERSTRTRTWPLYVLSLPAFVAIWSGWVGIGEKTGFGKVKLLPGISDFEINTAVTLPIGLETYAAYSMYAWLTASHMSAGTRKFAKWSALGSLALGTAGQATYHVMEAMKIHTAHVAVIIAVSAIPVIVMGLGIGLAHAMRHDIVTARTSVPETEVAHEPVSEPERHAEPEVVQETPGIVVEPEKPVELVPTPREPETVPGPRPESKTELPRDDRYAVGLHAYHVSKQGPGRPLSQRDLAAVMGLKNRELAIQIMRDYAKAIGEDEIAKLLANHPAPTTEPVTPDHEEQRGEIVEIKHAVPAEA